MAAEHAECIYVNNVIVYFTTEHFIFYNFSCGIANPACICTFEGNIDIEIVVLLCELICAALNDFSL